MTINDCLQYEPILVIFLVCLHLHLLYYMSELIKVCLAAFSIITLDQYIIGSISSILYKDVIGKNKNKNKNKKTF